ncbi:MAG TPA: class I SAM-dependent methyltransferase [Rhodospirillales bacterium]|nr:class I SAM-dependent methyltransferase [Rhodospirillales bacterium]
MGNFEVHLASVQAAYKRYSFVYDNVFGKLLEAGRTSATNIVNTRAGAGAKVLEAGVGTGLSLASYRPDLHVYGVDVSMEMLKRARNRVRKTPAAAPRLMLQMDAQRLAFKDGEFDFVVAMYVASVVPDLNALLGEVARVCKPGGEIIVVNHFKSSNKIMSRLEDAVAPLYRYIGFRPDLPMESILSDARFELKGTHPTNLFGEWWVLHLERRATLMTGAATAGE